MLDDVFDEDDTSFTFAIDEANMYFDINALTGQLSIKSGAPNLDFEVLGTMPDFVVGGAVIMTVDVSATDAGGRQGDEGEDQTRTTTVSVTLIDLNDMPSFADQSIDVEENQNPDAVLVNSLDYFGDSGDALADPSQKLSFRVTGVDPAEASSLFYVDAGINATTLNFRSGVLDFEAGAAVYTLYLEISDNGYPAQSTTGQITISILNVNEAPVFDADVVRYCVENAEIGYEVRSPLDLSAADPDSVERSLIADVSDVDVGDDAGNCCSSITFSIDTTEQTVFNLLPNTGLIIVANNDNLDFERSVTSWNLQVTASNEDGLSDTAEVLVYLTDQKEPPVFLASNEITNFVVSEKEVSRLPLPCRCALVSLCVFLRVPPTSRLLSSSCSWY
jgi:hypothetical protein